MTKILIVCGLILVGFGSEIASAQSCNNPNDRASDGSRCGGRAASERPGGR